MVSRDPEIPVRSPILRQRWESVGFLHWRYEPGEVAKVLPNYLRPEEIDGSAWLGLIPFMTRDTGPRVGSPRLPNFPETNLRTYVVTRRGRRAVWFFSLEAGNPLPAIATSPTLGIPYRWSSMTVGREGEHAWRYVSRRRRATKSIGHDIRIEVGAQIGADDETDLDRLLTARWRAVLPRSRGLLTVPVRHQPWPLHRAKVTRCEESLLRSCGFSRPRGEPHVLWSPGVDAIIGLPGWR